MKNKQPKILLWDIEASNLNANWGFVFCIGYMWLGEKKPTIISGRDFPAFKKNTTDDRPVLNAFQPVFESADIVVTHYGVRFDLPFIQTRRMIHGMQPMSYATHIDTWRLAKYTMKFNSNRLATVSESLPYKDLKKAPRKTPILPENWSRAIAGHLPSIKTIEEHCALDILVLRDTYMALRPFATNHPNLAKLIDGSKEGCPNCGSMKTERNGVRVTARGVHQRHRCRDCGASFNMPKRKTIAENK